METGDIIAIKSKLKFIKNIIKINGAGLFTDSSIINLGKLIYVKENLSLENCPIKSLDLLKQVDGDVYLSNSNIEDLGNLWNIQGSLIVENCKNLKSLGNVKYIGDNLYLKGTDITDLDGLQGCKRIFDFTGDRKKYNFFFDDTSEDEFLDNYQYSD